MGKKDTPTPTPTPTPSRRFTDTQNRLQAQTVIPSILLRYLSAYRLEFGFNSRRQFKGYVFLLQVKSSMIIFVFLLRELGFQDSRIPKSYGHDNCPCQLIRWLFD